MQQVLMIQTNRTHWIALCVNGNNLIYFDTFEIKDIPAEITKMLSQQK